MREKIPIVCTLSDKEMQERRKNILDKIVLSLIDSKELANGFRYRFHVEDALLQNLVTVINLERKCCSFLNFKLSLEAGQDFVSLDLTGRQGTKEIIRSLFNRNTQPTTGI